MRLAGPRSPIGASYVYTVFILSIQAGIPIRAYPYLLFVGEFRT